MFKTRAPSCQALDGSKVASQIIRVHNGRSRASAMESERDDDLRLLIRAIRRLVLDPCAILT